MILVGATTENPAFELNNALLSRLRVYVLKPLVDIELRRVLDRALTDKEKGVGRMRVELNDNMVGALVRAADGDARRLLNFLEVAVQLGVDDDGNVHITEDMLPDITGATTRRFDRGGDYFYDQISALHKSIRGTDPDAVSYTHLTLPTKA